MITFTFTGESIEELQQQLRAVLSSSSVEATNGGPPGTQAADHFCYTHEMEMTRQENDRGCWWSHQDPAGGWCKGGK